MPSKIRSIAERQSASGVWTVPTIIQADRGLADEDTLRDWLASDELRFIERDAREFWADSVRRSARRMDDADWALVEQGRRNRLALTRAPHEAGVRLLVATIVGVMVRGRWLSRDDIDAMLNDLRRP